MLDYCADLDRNNDRVWFRDNHGRYEAARGDFLKVLDMLRFSFADCAPAVYRDVQYMAPADWMYRIARDMRYSRNCPPYNPAFRAYICADRKSWQPIGYYLRVAPGTSCYGTGLWCWETAQTNRARDWFCIHYEEFEALLAESGLTLSGDRLRTMPRGYDPAHPAAELLKYKNWSVIQDLPDAQLGGMEDFDGAIRALTARMEPLRAFLLEAGRAG